ncbi:GAF domain-containing protein [Acrasis kona]|uniref:GAF domain-containing protein n=1 Tax=Acrasis kona TaxID=1008807 RepID=A0AAW2Z473_9EUKA
MVISSKTEEVTAYPGKTKFYSSLIDQIKSLTDGESNLICNLANCASLFYMEYKKYPDQFDVNWFGFYMVDKKKPSTLVLGPFMGNIACTRIPKGKGVCGTCMEKDETVIVKDVHEFPGHIACDSASNSEICVPVHNNKGDFACLIDVDSRSYSQFDDVDKCYLENVASIIQNRCEWE